MYVIVCPFQELLREQSYDEKSDLWSLGCLIYELCALVPPFLAPNQKVLAMRIKLGHYKRIPTHYSSQLQSAIASLIQTEVRTSSYQPPLMQGHSLNKGHVAVFISHCSLVTW